MLHCSIWQKYSSHSLPLNFNLSWAYGEFLREDSVEMLLGQCFQITDLFFMFHSIKTPFSAAHKDKEPALPLPTQVRGPHSLIAFGKDAITIAFTFITDQVRQIKNVGWWWSFELWSLTMFAFQVPISSFSAPGPPARIQSCHPGEACGISNFAFFRLTSIFVADLLPWVPLLQPHAHQEVFLKAQVSRGGFSYCVSFASKFIILPLLGFPGLAC